MMRLLRNSDKSALALTIFPEQSALGSISTEQVLALAIAVALAVVPISPLWKAILLIVLFALLIELIRRSISANYMKFAVGGCTLVAASYLWLGPINAEFRQKSILTGYQSQIEEFRKYQLHDETLRMIVTQYDRLRQAQSLFTHYLHNRSANIPEIDGAQAEDLAIAINNLDAKAILIGDPRDPALKLKLGQNMYRIIFSVPMAAPPKLTFFNLPEGVKAQMIEDTVLIRLTPTHTSDRFMVSS